MYIHTYSTYTGILVYTFTYYCVHVHTRVMTDSIPMHIHTYRAYLELHVLYVQDSRCILMYGITFLVLWFV